MISFKYNLMFTVSSKDTPNLAATKQLEADSPEMSNYLLPLLVVEVKKFNIK